jgi:cell division septum initiation protein DivIVA
VRARASSTTTATRREVEQSIKRFEKRLDESNEALKTLGKHLGRGGQSSYKEVTTALRALRREAAKTNKQALKDFDKLRAALTQTNARKTSTARSGTKRSSATKSANGRSTASRSTASRSKASRSTSTKSTGTRSTRSRSTGTRSGGSRSTSSS